MKNPSQRFKIQVVAVALLVLGAIIPASSACVLVYGHAVLGFVALAIHGAWIGALIDYRRHWWVPFQRSSRERCEWEPWSALGACPVCLAIIAMHRLPRWQHWVCQATGACLTVLAHGVTGALILVLGRGYATLAGFASVG